MRSHLFITLCFSFFTWSEWFRQGHGTLAQSNLYGRSTSSIYLPLFSWCFIVYGFSGPHPGRRHLVVALNIVSFWLNFSILLLNCTAAVLYCPSQNIPFFLQRVAVFINHKSDDLRLVPYDFASCMSSKVHSIRSKPLICARYMLICPISHLLQLFILLKRTVVLDIRRDPRLTIKALTLFEYTLFLLISFRSNCYGIG